MFHKGAQVISEQAWRVSALNRPPRREKYPIPSDAMYRRRINPAFRKIVKPSRYSFAEFEAGAKKVGLWSDPKSVPPWEWLPR